MEILKAIEELKKLAEENPNYELAVIGMGEYIALEKMEVRKEDGEEFVLLY